MDIISRTNNYDKPHCWQYQKRIENYEEDVHCLNIEPSNVHISDFNFIKLEEKTAIEDAKQFIKRHEWLGSITQYTTHWFGAYYENILAGVIAFSLPNNFSKMLGENTKNLERLISRGACISWSPKCLASNFLMWCITYMVKNTGYRLFTAYSDPTAKELGTIYQACNFYYLGKNAGTTKRYVNPYTGKIVSDRFFRQKSAYKKYAAEVGIAWGKDWIVDNKINWENVPDDIEKILRNISKQKQECAAYFIFPNKHKYAFVLGKTKSETNLLRKEFLKNNKTFVYPKVRGE